MVNIVRNKNGDPVWKTITPRTRLKFSIAVIVANFILGIIGMILGADLTALGVFLSLSNAPLYVYVLGESLRPTPVPEAFYRQPHGGSGGIGTIVNPQGNNQNWGGGNEWGGGYGDGGSGGYGGPSNWGGGGHDEYNIPTDIVITTTKPSTVKPVKKDESEIG